jgi:predicted RNA-binding protein with PUA-like domain
MAYWLFYSGPENYLSAEGERNFAAETGLWSGAPGVRNGDLAVLYRRSLTKVSVGQMREMTGMSLQRAREVKLGKIGSDIPVVWRIVSDDKGPFNSWSHGYDVEPLRTIDPPITLRELKAEPRLRNWEDLRWNFQAQGREALEIPDSAWAVLQDMIDRRGGHERS